MVYLMTEGGPDLFKVEAAGCADEGKREAAPASLPADGARVDAQDEGQLVRVEQRTCSRRPVGACDMSTIRSIGLLRLDEPGLAWDHGSHLWALMSDST